MLALACVAALGAVLKYTSLGRRIRATVQNRDLAATSGISTGRVDRITFFIGSGLAGVAGVAVALISRHEPDAGHHTSSRRFLVVVVGGIGQLKGTVIAALALGVRHARSSPTGRAAASRRCIVFALVVVFLQVRPQGLFTVRTRSLA